MDLLFSLGGIVLLLCITLSTYFLYYYQPKYDAPMLPGTLGLPLFGESFAFLSAGRRGKPESFIYDRLAKYAPHRLFKTSLFGKKTVVMCGTQSNKLLFSNERKLVQMYWPPSIDRVFPSTVNLTPNEESIKMRKFLPDFLNKVDCLRRYIPIIDDCTRRHFASGAWGPTDWLEAYEVAKGYTFWVACRLFMSIDSERDPKTVQSLFAHFNTLLRGIYSFPLDLPFTSFRAALKASETIRKNIEGIVKKRKMELAEGKAAPKQDILSYMLVTPTSSTEEMGKQEFYSDKDLATKILGLLVGGHDTTSTVITFVLKSLAELPHVYDAVYKEQMEIAKTKAAGELLTWEDLQKMKYSYCVIQEVMRLYPPVQGAFRQAITDFTFQGFQIPKGWKLYWSTHSTHRNPECFPEPEKFDPTRFEGNGPQPFSFVPFGGGPRMCPGKEYARLKVLVFMYNMVTRFRWETLVPNEKIIVSPMPYPANNLPLRMIPHKGE